VGCIENPCCVVLSIEDPNTCLNNEMLLIEWSVSGQKPPTKATEDQEKLNYFSMPGSKNAIASVMEKVLFLIYSIVIDFNMCQQCLMFKSSSNIIF